MASTAAIIAVSRRSYAACMQPTVLPGDARLELEDERDEDEDEREEELKEEDDELKEDNELRLKLELEELELTLELEELELIDEERLELEDELELELMLCAKAGNVIDPATRAVAAAVSNFFIPG